LNLYNAALVTPTYYVYFTSATIVSDAILYRGFKGSAIQIITVVLGFLQICSGVVLLQLSKSAKDVPDTAVFSGDVDQVRTMAEQEEPEYEPRADTMRGTAALIRSMSQVRHKRETKDVMRIKEEHMAPIGEGEEVEWDGLRRRRTMSSPRTPQMRPNSQRRRTIHPPLGMSHFPEETEEDPDPDNGMHPGFWSHFKRKPVGDSTEAGSVPMGPVSNDGSGTVHNDLPPGTASPQSSRSSHIFGLPMSLRRPSRMNESPPLPPHHDNETLQDTAYHGASDTTIPTRIQSHHVQWSDPQSAEQVAAGGSRLRSDTVDSESDPSASFIPLAPPHISLEDIPKDASDAATRRQFSFSSIFNRSGSRDGQRTPVDPSTLDSTTIVGPGMLGGMRSTSSPARHPAGQSNRSGLSFSRRAGQVSGTEEERAGLVKGDASAPESSPPRYESPEGSPTRAPQGGYPARGDSLARAGNTVREPSTLRLVSHTRGPSGDLLGGTTLSEPSMPVTRASQVESELGNRSDAESIQVHLHPALVSKVGLVPTSQGEKSTPAKKETKKDDKSDKDDDSPSASGGAAGPTVFI
jgi:hypothetical protein